MNAKHPQSGNALWFILVAIVLLGALTILLTRSGSSVTQSGNTEQLRIKASQVLRYTKGLESAVSQMKARGISESDISFETGGTSVSYANAACGIPDCMVFQVAGGGMEYKDPPSGANDGSEWIFSGANNVGTTANPIGTTAIRTGNDLVMLLPNADTNLCKQINRDLRVGTAGTLPIDTTGINTTAFTGTYTNALTVLDGDGAPFELDGKSAGCFIDAAPDPDVVYFYFVLLAR